MHLYRSLNEFIEKRTFSAAPPVVTVGSFDGVHLGHQYLMNELIEWAGELEASPLVITFHTHPRTFMTGEEIKRITPIEQKLVLLRELGIREVLLLDFDEGVRDTTAFDFCREFLIDGLKAQGLLIGHNNRIGKGREGTPESLQAFGKEVGFAVRIAEKVEVGGLPISSSAIRDHIESGDFLWSRKMLGRPYGILSTVAKGKQLGRTIGFPTINLSLSGICHPPLGVYGVRVELLPDSGDPDAAPERYIGAANIGLRPTVEDAKEPLLEVHLIDYEGDCYGRLARVIFHFKLRDEEKFAGLDALKAQLASDVAETRRRFDAASESGRMPGV